MRNFVSINDFLHCNFDRRHLQWFVELQGQDGDQFLKLSVHLGLFGWYIESRIFPRTNVFLGSLFNLISGGKLTRDSVCSFQY